MAVVITEERPDTPEALALIEELDAHLAPLYPRESRHGFSVEKLLREGVTFFVTRDGGRAAGCGGVLIVGREYAEVKRMYVRPAFRGRGLGRLMLDHLVGHARARGLTVIRLETGIHQPEAIALYERSGFRRIPPFGPYWDDPLSRCYEKVIGAAATGQRIGTISATSAKRPARSGLPPKPAPAAVAARLGGRGRAATSRAPADPASSCAGAGRTVKEQAEGGGAGPRRAGPRAGLAERRGYPIAAGAGGAGPGAASGRARGRRRRGGSARRPGPA